MHFYTSTDFYDKHLLFFICNTALKTRLSFLHTTYIQLLKTRYPIYLYEKDR